MAYSVHPAEDLDLEQQLLSTPLLDESNFDTKNNEICDQSFEEDGGEPRRPWEDLCPYLLNLIYAKLPTHIDGTEFGSVCRNWRQVHSAAALSTPLPLAGDGREKHESTDDNKIRFGEKYVVTKTTATDIRMATGLIPKGHRLSNSGATIVGRAGSWWLPMMEDFGRTINCCFNPLLRSPENLIDLPSLPTKPLLGPPCRKVKAAFSALPTARDWAILVLHSPSRLSTLRRGQRSWRRYDFGAGDGGELDCAGIGYRDGKFFCLFENGNLLIFSVEDGGERRMWIAGATPAPPPPNLQHLDRLDNYLRADSEIGHLRVSWGRVDETEEGSFRLLAVEKETSLMAAEEGDEEAVVRLEEGRRVGGSNTAVVLLEGQLPIRQLWGRNFYFVYRLVWGVFATIFCLFACGPFLFITILELV